MKLTPFYRIIFLLCAFNSPYSIQAIFPTTVKVQIDLDHLSEQIGKQSKNVTHNTTTGIAEGLSSAAGSSQFRDAIRNIFRGIFNNGSNELANAIKDKQFQNNINKATDAGAELLGNSTSHALLKTTEELNKAISDENLRKELHKTSTETTRTLGVATEAFVDGLDNIVLPHIDRLSRRTISSVYNLRNALQFGVPAAIAIALPLAGLYGSRVFWRVLEKNLLTPQPRILLPGSKYGRWDRIKRWRSGYKSPAMIFDEQVKERLIEIEEKTKNIRNHIRKNKKMTYDNLLLYGEPGTGKTLFAQLLADKTNMDFLPVTAASLLQSGVEGIKYFDELLVMANRSKYGVIIFVDEADALFVNRDSLSPESDHYKVLNHILALTGSGSNKFMLIAATNHAYVMDQAMGRRFQDRVLMPLPNTKTRKDLLNLYINQILFNAKDNSSKFIETAKSLLTIELFKNMVEKTNNLSHAEIKDMVVAIHKKACATQTGLMTTKNIESAIQEAVEKKQALENDKKTFEEQQARTKKSVL